MNDAEIKLQVKIDDSSASKSITTLESKMKSLSSTFTNTGKNLTAGLTLPIVGLMATGVKYNATVETLTASFKTMTGSAKEAGDIVKRLKDIGSKTPFEFTDLAETTKLLMNYGMTADDAISRMQMLGDISQGSAEKMNRIATAYGQMSSAGKVNLEDVKQMIEAGFNPLKEISESTGESMLSLYDRISKGKISVDEITSSMTRSTSEGGKYFNSMDIQSQTTTGKISTLKDEFLNASGTLTTALMPALSTLVGWFTQLSIWFSQLNPQQQQWLLILLGVLAILGPVILLVGALVTGIGLLLSPIGLVLIAIGLVIAVIVYLWYQFKGSIDSMVLWGDKLVIFFNGLWQTVKNVFNNIKDFVAGVFKGIINGFIVVINSMISGLNTLIKVMLSPFNAVITGLNKIPGVNIPKLKLEIPKIPKLATGTNYVGQDGLAYLHQGEAVVPKKYNPAMGGMQSITVQIPGIYLDGQKVSRAVVPYITKTVKMSGGNI